MAVELHPDVAFPELAAPQAVVAEILADWEKRLYRA